MCMCTYVDHKRVFIVDYVLLVHVDHVVISASS